MSVLVGAALEGWRRVRLAVRRPDDEDCWFADYVEALGQAVIVAGAVLHGGLVRELARVG